MKFSDQYIQSLKAAIDRTCQVFVIESDEETLRWNNVRQATVSVKRMKFGWGRPEQSWL